MKKHTTVGLIALASVIISLTLGFGTRYAQAYSEDFFENLSTFTDVIKIVKDNYVDLKKVNEDSLIIGAVRGMLETLDKHTTYLDKNAFQMLTSETSGSFGGLGIQIAIKEGVLTIITPMVGTPAHRIGLLPGDIISKIEGVSTQGISQIDAVNKLRGKPGTSVTITIIREGVPKPIDYTITRAIIELNSVPAAFMVSNDIGYIKITEFEHPTFEKLTEALRKLKTEGMQKLILDLRNNPGGLLISSVDISNLFLPEGRLIVTTKGREASNQKEFRSNGKTEFSTIPMAVLVNLGSASASEIVTGALKDNKRATVIGSKTFGKGSVQNIFRLKNEDALKLTIALYYTPSGVCIHDKGIEPDIKVEDDRYPMIIAYFRRHDYFRKFITKKLGTQRIKYGDFKVDDTMLNEFYNYLKERQDEFSKELFSDTVIMKVLKVHNLDPFSELFNAAKDDIIDELTVQAYYLGTGEEASIRYLLKNDSVTKKAISVLETK